MFSEIKEEKPQSKEWWQRASLPCLVRNERYVVLVTHFDKNYSRFTGTVIYHSKGNNHGPNDLGYHCTTWVTGAFRPFTGEIVIGEPLILE